MQILTTLVLRCLRQGKPIDVRGDFLQDCANVYAAAIVRGILVAVPEIAPAIGL